MKLYFEDEAFDGQLQRTVGKCDAGMANVGECLYIASRIDARRPRQLVRGMVGVCRRPGGPGRDRRAGRSRRQRSRPAPARGRVLPPGVLLASRRPRRQGADHRLPGQCRRVPQALPALPRPGRIVDGDTPGYLFTPAGGGPFPTILHIGGYDSTAEELYASVYPALDRGWAFVALDGPGQGSVLYERRIPQRPDWEHVVPGMFDLVAALPEVDASRIVLVGRSFGGAARPARRGRRPAPGRTDRRPRPVRHGRRHARPPGRALAAHRRPRREAPVRRAARRSRRCARCSGRAWSRTASPTRRPTSRTCAATPAPSMAR